MRPTSVTVGSAASSAWIPVNWRQNPFELSIQITAASAGTNTSKVEVTHDDVFDATVTPTAITAASPFDSITNGASTSGKITTPVKAVRLTISSYTSGSVQMTVMQGS